MSIYGVWQLTRLRVFYSPRGGSSRGARHSTPHDSSYQSVSRDFVGNYLPKFREENPQLEILVEERPGHPSLEGTYRNEVVKEVQVKNWLPKDILLRAECLRSSYGRRSTKNLRRHITERRSVQGRWTPDLFT